MTDIDPSLIKSLRDQYRIEYRRMINARVSEVSAPGGQWWRNPFKTMWPHPDDIPDSALLSLHEKDGGGV